MLTFDAYGQTRTYGEYIPQVDAELYGRMLMKKDAEYKAAVEKIQSMINKTADLLNANRKRGDVETFNSLVLKYQKLIKQLNDCQQCDWSDSKYYNWIMGGLREIYNAEVENINNYEEDQQREAQEQAVKDATFNMEYFEGALNDKKYDECLTYIEKFIPTNRSNSFLYFYKGFIYSKMDNYEEAVNNYSQAIKLNQINNKSDDQTYYYRAYLYRSHGSYKEAIADFTMCINNNYKKYDCMFERALCKDQIKDYYGSLSDYEDIINNQANLKDEGFLIATVYNNKANSLLMLGNLSEATTWVNKAMELAPNEAYIWSTRGEIYFRKGNYKLCISDMQKDIELTLNHKSKSQSVEGVGYEYYFIGLSYIKLGNKSQGCINLSKSGENGYTKAYEEINRYCK